MLEPGALKLHIRLFCNIIKCKILDEANEEQIEPICILFNSTLNIEFVYVILEGIVKFSKMNFETEDQINGMFEIQTAETIARREKNGDVILEIK